MAAPLLTLQNIKLRFGNTQLLDGAELSVSAGERFCLVGRNGSGKSTLLKIAAGLIEPDGGTRFAQSLVHTGLIDEFWFAIHPIVLGRGFHLFSELKSPLDLKLVSSVSFEVGTLANIYSI